MSQLHRARVNMSCLPVEALRALVGLWRPCMESLQLRNAAGRQRPRRSSEIQIWWPRLSKASAHWRRSTPGHAHWPSVAFSISLRCWPLGSGSSSSSTPLQGRRRDTRSGYRSLPLLPSPYSKQTYGNGPPSFLHRCVHYSLKIPPKKRRRFSNAYLPLSHVSTPPRPLFRGELCARAASVSVGGR